MHRRLLSTSSKVTSQACPIRIASTSTVLLSGNSSGKLRSSSPARLSVLRSRSFSHSAWSLQAQPVSRAASTSTSPIIVRHSDVSRAVTVRFTNGKETSFHYLWLRDHCRESRSHHPSTRQRLVDTPTLPADLAPEKIEASHDGLHVTWPTATGSGESYSSFFPWTFLIKHSYEPAIDPDLGPRDDKILWTSDIGKTPPMVEYEQVMQSEEGVYKWVKRIHQFGFSFVRGIPPTPEATEALIRRIAFIRDTHYGGFWDFTADLKHGDLAYSNVVLNSHTDTTYFTDPCGLQLFHLLSPSTSHKGGHNLLVDGFRAAKVLQKTDPSSYDFLSSVLVPSHASGTGSDSLPSGVHLSPLTRKPVFNHDPSSGELIQVRWNGDDRDVVGGKGWEGGKMEQWFEAMRKWETILRSDESQLWTEMEMGTAVIFDNHRVLHGRSSFTGERRLCGAYINHDDYRSRYIGLHKQFGPKQDLEQARAALKAEFGIQVHYPGGVWEGW